VCKAILELMNIKVKGDGLTQVGSRWSEVCSFLIKWEGVK